MTDLEASGYPSGYHAVPMLIYKSNELSNFSFFTASDNFT